MDRLFPAACLFATLLTGCAQHTPKQAAPPLRVGVAEAAVDSVPNRMSFIGYLASNFDAVIQPRVNGYLSFEAIRQRHARTARPAAVHHRPRPAVDLDAGGRSRTRIGPCAGPRSPQQLRPRRAAGAHRRHQPVAAGPVHGPMEGRRGLGALGGAVAAQRPHERGIHRAALAHRRHHRAHGGARGRLRAVPARSSAC